MRQRRLSAHRVSVLTDINARTLSDYLAARTRPAQSHVERLCRLFEVEPEVMIGPGNRWRVDVEAEFAYRSESAEEASTDCCPRLAHTRLLASCGPALYPALCASRDATSQ